MSSSKNTPTADRRKITVSGSDLGHLRELAERFTAGGLNIDFERLGVLLGMTPDEAKETLQSIAEKVTEPSLAEKNSAGDGGDKKEA